METYDVEVTEKSTSWFKPGTRIYHRLDGPAFESKIWGTEYLVDGKNHREDGPAVIWASGNVAYYLHGEKYYTEESYWAAVEELKNPKQKSHQELTVAQIEELLGYPVKIVKE